MIDIGSEEIIYLPFVVKNIKLCAEILKKQGYYVEVNHVENFVDCIEIKIMDKHYKTVASRKEFNDFIFTDKVRFLKFASDIYETL